MNAWTLIWRSLVYHWRTHVGVVLGVALATAVLVGALLVGDSVRYSLRQAALDRLGHVHAAMITGDRLFHSDLAQRAQADLPEANVVPVLMLNGGARYDADDRPWVNGLTMLGVDSRFWKLAHQDAGFESLPEDCVLINRQVAAALGAGPGDVIRMRVENPSPLPRDTPLASDDNLSPSVTLIVAGVIDREQLGGFALNTGPGSGMNIVLHRSQLRQIINTPGQGDANVLLVGSTTSHDDLEAFAVHVDETVRRHLSLSDLNLKLQMVEGLDQYELRSDRVFLDAPVIAAAQRAFEHRHEVLTYLANRISKLDADEPVSLTPYSLVAALQHPEALPIELDSPLRDDQIIINTWLAEDQGLAVGDAVEIEYFIIDEGRVLREATARFEVAAIVPIEELAADRTLMPDYTDIPVDDALSNWRPSFELKYRIRREDDQYWDQHRGTPKAFITLSAGQRLWHNRFGDLTAVRVDVGHRDAVYTEPGTLAAVLLDQLDARMLGFVSFDVRGSALRAAGEARDFGQLFMGFSFFLIVAAMLLTALLFRFSVEQRTVEIGTMLALGFAPRRVRNLLLAEGMLLAALGCALGVLGGVQFTKAVLHALASIWQSVVSDMGITYHATAGSLITGTGAGLLIALAVLWITVRRLGQRTARELLTLSDAMTMFMQTADDHGTLRRRWPRYAALGMFVVAMLMLPLGWRATGTQAAGVFFGAGSLVLLAGLVGVYQLMRSMCALPDPGEAIAQITLVRAGVRGSARRKGRSLATVGLLACGCFMVVGTHAFHKDVHIDARDPRSGTGGFTLYAESTIPVLHDPATASGRERLALDDLSWDGIHVASLRVRDGDEASCLNLNRPQTPRLLGVRPEQLAGRFHFTQRDHDWGLLEQPLGDDIIPVIADQQTLQWALGKRVGDVVTYLDHQSQPVKLRIVGSTTSSILQGSLLIHERDLQRLFPAQAGYHIMLFDLPADADEELRRTLTFALGDRGLQLTDTRDRLARFNEVENTYLSIFQALGALGLLLGSIGLGIVVLRNLLERRGELALLRAVGFRVRALHALVLAEHWLLLGFGVLIGVVAALVAVLPALLAPAASPPIAQMALIVVLIVICGVIWTVLATAFALRGPLLDSLRAE